MQLVTERWMNAGGETGETATIDANATLTMVEAVDGVHPDHVRDHLHVEGETMMRRMTASLFGEETDLAPARRLEGKIVDRKMVLLADVEIVTPHRRNDVEMILLRWSAESLHRDDVKAHEERGTRSLRQKAGQRDTIRPRQFLAIDRFHTTNL